MTRLELKLPPVLVTVLTAALMYGLARAFPGTRLPNAPFFSWLALVAALSGVAVGFLGVWTFYRHRTTVSPTKPSSATAVVRSGVYRVTRNPMYLGLALLLLAWALYLRQPLALPLLPLFTLYLTRFQIMPEERALLYKFGEPYADYLRAVRRWL
jgi:protein-S-isoprenylcysteine O-methyltransferase Ste14